MRRQGPNTSQRRFLVSVERCLRTIRYPVDEAGFFHAQCHRALLMAGFNVIREVGMDGAGSHARRVDLVVVDRTGVLAIELDHQEVPPRTLQKLEDLPEEVLRMVVLRDREPPLLRVPFADRVVCMRSDMRAVEWLNSGTAICEEVTVPSLVPDNRLAISRVPETVAARRLIAGPRRGPIAVAKR